MTDSEFTYKKKRRGGERWADKAHYCIVCEEQFFSSRYNAKCCSGGCRVKLHRKQKKELKISEKIKDLVNEISEFTRSSNLLDGQAAENLRVANSWIKFLIEERDYQLPLFEDKAD